MKYDRDSFGVKMHHWRIVGQALARTRCSSCRDCLESCTEGHLIGGRSVVYDATKPDYSDCEHE